MSMTDPVANMLAAIKNGQMALKPSAYVHASKAKRNVLQVLKDEGYIEDFSDAQDENGHPVIKIDLKYYEGKGVITQLKKISKPGRRVYAQVGKFPKIYNGSRHYRHQHFKRRDE